MKKLEEMTDIQSQSDNNESMRINRSQNSLYKDYHMASEESSEEEPRVPRLKSSRFQKQNTSMSRKTDLEKFECSNNVRTTTTTLKEKISNNVIATTSKQTNEEQEKAKDCSCVKNEGSFSILFYNKYYLLFFVCSYAEENFYQG